ncbi:Outer membrane protein OprM precursor [Symmachiella dynata]|uniref:efflux transporter outer membrane subunit n=1 Tax=Symmachiella dynata TaxID=2527995 RepID=UPI00118CD01E|nr:Outer membrane protein OprM precursor [Symmachiella dynata]
MLFIGVSCMLASGCGLSQWVQNGFQVGPDYHPPAASVSEHWIDIGNEHVLHLPPDDPYWWSVFEDPILNNLVQTALAQNLTLRQAGSRIMQARASRAITAGNLFPQVQQSFGDATRIQESQSVALPPPIRAFDEWDVGFNASWEIDVWGKFRRALETADARLEASIYDYDAVLVSLLAEVVSAYVDIRTFEQRIQYAKQNVMVQESSLQLSTTRFDEGKTSKVGVYLAEANLNGTEATLPALETGLRQASNRLCTLLGIPPTDLSTWLGEGDGIPEVPADIAVGIPADLLRRRPDVRQAERQVAAQSAQIGVAVSDLFPSISLNGEVFQSSEDFGDLFNSASAAGSIGPSFRWNILNYGRITNNVRLQDARLLELIASYQNTVLVASQEVEDALIAFLKSKREVVSLRNGVDNLNESLKLLLIQFEEGSIDFSPIFVLQGSLRSAQDQMAAAEGQVLLNMVAVYRALGGGWKIRYPGFETQVMPVDDQPTDAATDPFLAPEKVEQGNAQLEEFLMPAPGVVPKEDSEDGQ